MKFVLDVGVTAMHVHVTASSDASGPTLKAWDRICDFIADELKALDRDEPDPSRP